MASDLAKTSVAIVIEPPSETALADLIKKAKAGALRGTTCMDKDGNVLQKDFVHIYYDVKVSGRAASAPHLRPPTLRSNHLSKNIGAMIKSRTDKDNVAPGDLDCIYDAKKHGNETDFLKVFRAEGGSTMPKQCITSQPYI